VLLCGVCVSVCVVSETRGCSFETTAARGLVRKLLAFCVSGSFKARYSVSCPIHLSKDARVPCALFGRPVLIVQRIFSELTFDSEPTQVTMQPASSAASSAYATRLFFKSCRRGKTRGGGQRERDWRDLDLSYFLGDVFFADVSASPRVLLYPALVPRFDDNSVVGRPVFLSPGQA
jgi:hypothetical protein